MHKEHPQTAKRIGLKLGEHDALLAFFSTNTGIHVSPSVEDEFIAIRVDKFALGEIYIRLRAAIMRNPAEYGLTNVL